MRNGSHCRFFGSAEDCLIVYGVDYTNMSFLCYHWSILENKDAENAARHARIYFVS